MIDAAKIEAVSRLFLKMVEDEEDGEGWIKKAKGRKI